MSSCVQNAYLMWVRSWTKLKIQVLFYIFHPFHVTQTLAFLGFIACKTKVNYHLFYPCPHSTDIPLADPSSEALPGSHPILHGAPSRLCGGSWSCPVSWNNPLWAWLSESSCGQLTTYAWQASFGSGSFCSGFLPQVHLGTWNIWVTVSNCKETVKAYNILLCAVLEARDWCDNSQNLRREVGKIFVWCFAICEPLPHAPSALWYCGQIIVPIVQMMKLSLGRHFLFHGHRPALMEDKGYGLLDYPSFSFHCPLNK